MANFPNCFKPRAKRQHREKHFSINYNTVIVLGEYDGLFGYGTQAVGELLAAEFNGRMYPCYRRKSTKVGVITAICHDSQMMSCSIEEFKAFMEV